MRYRIEYDDAALVHLEKHLDARQRATIVDTVDRKLGDEPTAPSRNRKLLRANPLAPWELRVGDLRVYYDVQEHPERIVTIRAVGRKDRDRVLIGAEEWKL